MVRKNQKAKPVNPGLIMEIEYSPFFSFFIKYFSSLRILLSLIPLNFFRKLYVLMYQEKIHALCKKIYSSSDKIPFLYSIGHVALKR